MKTPAALELRRMQMLTEIGAEQNTMTVVMMPSEFVSARARSPKGLRCCRRNRAKGTRGRGGDDGIVGLGDAGRAGEQLGRGHLADLSRHADPPEFAPSARLDAAGPRRAHGRHPAAHLGARHRERHPAAARMADPAIQASELEQFLRAATAIFVSFEDATCCAVRACSTPRQSPATKLRSRCTSCPGRLSHRMGDAEGGDAAGLPRLCRLAHA